MTRLASWISGVGLALIGTPANADILYDSLRPLNDLTYPVGTFDVPPNFIGGTNVFGVALDMQVADDFTLSNPHLINRVTIDNYAEGASITPSSVLVEVFADVGGRPADMAHHALTVGSGNLSHELFTNGGGFGDGSAPGIRLGVDLTGLGVELGAGSWWISVVPISEDHFYQSFRVYDQTTGAPAYYRNGGQAHGNGAPVGPFGSYDWMLWGGPDGVNPDPSNIPLGGDIAMRIEGTAVPAPSALALLGLSALGAARRRR